MEQNYGHTYQKALIDEMETEMGGNIERCHDYFTELAATSPNTRPSAIETNSHSRKIVTVKEESDSFKTDTDSLNGSINDDLDKEINKDIDAEETKVDDSKNKQSIQYNRKLLRRKSTLNEMKSSDSIDEPSPSLNHN